MLVLRMWLIECWYTENPFTDAIEKSHESEWRHWILHIALGILCIFSVFATLVFFYAIKLKSSSHLTPMLIYNKIELVLHIVTFSCFAIVSVQLLVEDALGKSHDELDISEPVYRVYFHILRTLLAYFIIEEAGEI